MKQLEYLKWGTVRHDKALEKIEKTKNRKNTAFRKVTRKIISRL